MNDPLRTPYFQRLRRLHSCELQLMSFLPELQSRSLGKLLAQQMAELIVFCRERRNAIELLALSHGLSASGDACAGMASLIGREWRALTRQSGLKVPNDFISDIAEALHRKLILDYSLARGLASRLKFADDAGILDDMADRLIGLFPGVWQHADPVLPQAALR